MASRDFSKVWILTALLLLVTGCGGGGGGGSDSPDPQPPAVPVVAGEWQISETLADDCGSSGTTNTYVATVTQNGSQVVVTYGGVSRSGTMTGNELTWSGSYPEDGGTTTVSSLILNFSGDSATGNATWSWTDGTQSCSGTSSITATRLSTPAPAAPTDANAVATSSGSVDLMWRDNSDNEQSFVIERSAVSITTGFTVAATVAADSQSYADSGLTPATTYYYRVAASNADGQSDFSNVASVTTEAAPLQPPLAPSGLNGSAINSTSVQLFWIDNSDNESSFEVFQALGTAGNFNLVSTRPANETSVVIDGLDPATDYAFKVVAINSAGSSPDSNIQEITTPADARIPTTPSVPTVGDATSSSLTLRWMDLSDNETGFRIYRSASRDGQYVEVTTTAASATSYTNTGLAPSTTYWYRISAFNATGESALTAPVSGMTSAPPITVPTTPSGLTVGSATASSLTLNWTDTSDNETGFRVFRSESENGSYVEIATTLAAEANYVDRALRPSTEYWYRVSAFNSAGESTASRSANGTTLAPPSAVPEAPTEPGIANLGETSVTITWVDNSDNETGFELGTCTGTIVVSSNLLRCMNGFTQFAQVGADITALQVTGLQPNTRYDIFVRAFNSAGESNNTGVRFTTTAGQQTVTLSAIATNAVIANSLDSQVAETAYPNSFPAVGVNWAFNLTGTSDSVAFAGLVKFDTTSLQGRTIVSATLNFESRTAPPGFNPQNFDIGTVATFWDQSTVTWNQATGLLYYNAGWTRDIAYPTFVGQDYAINMTGVVQNWANGLFDNEGIGFFSSNYAASPGNNSSLDAYDFTVPTLTVTFE
ncbi:MAG: fibronectin type III domain-containing protein [Pseudomonadota bacterium]